MGRVLSIDLASKKVKDVGACLIHEARGRPKEVHFPAALDDLGLQDPLTAEQCAQAIYNYCARHEIALVFLDGPQGWMDPDSELKDKRRCEERLNTQAKTGREGQVKPRSFKRFVEFSIAVFSELTRRGADLVKDSIVPIPEDRLLVAESYPRSAWKKLSIEPLPGKKKKPRSDISRCLTSLEKLYRFEVPREPTHDELCALVAGLAGVAILVGNSGGYIAEGDQPKELGGVIVEGFIVNPCIEGRLP